MSLPHHLPPIDPESSYPSFLSAEYANYFVKMYNVIRKMEVVGGRVVWSDANVKLITSASAIPAVQTPSSSSVTYVSSSIYCMARWS